MYQIFARFKVFTVVKIPPNYKEQQPRKRRIVQTFFMVSSFGENLWVCLDL